MKAITGQIWVSIMECQELLDDMQALLQEAEQARLSSYAPYSNYWVGSAVKDNNGRVYRGCNVERVSHSQTTHAEQNAIDSMVASGVVGSYITAIAIVALPRESTPQVELTAQVAWTLENIPAPCGHCRQIIQEHAGGSNPQVIFLLPNGEVAVTTLEDIFPMPFKAL